MDVARGPRHAYHVQSLAPDLDPRAFSMFQRQNRTCVWRSETALNKLLISMLCS